MPAKFPLSGLVKVAVPDSLLFTDPEVGEALEANVVAFFSRMGAAPGGQVERSAEMIRIASGVPFPIFNWVLRNRFDPSETEARVSTTIRYYRERGLPFFWAIFPNDRPAGLREALLARGFEGEEAPAMAIDLGRPLAGATASGLAIHPVRTREEMQVFARTLNSGDFNAGMPIVDALPGLLRPTLTSPDREPQLRCFVGYRGGVPVATSLGFLSDGVAGVYGVATVPDARRQGFGSAMTLAALEDGRAAGYRVGVLLATRMGEPVYRRMGFRELFRVGQFTKAEPPQAG
jgi:ribosomal protein S18 acetylase RimI-like enzyme